MERFFLMQINITADAADCGHMSPEEYGVLMRLRSHYWRGGRLPTDDHRLARIVKLSLERWIEIKPVVAEFFDENWKSGDLDEMMAKAVGRHKNAVAKGHAGAEARRLKKAAEANGFEPGSNLGSDLGYDPNSNLGSNSSYEPKLSNQNHNRREQEAQDIAITHTREEGGIHRAKTSGEALAWLSQQGIFPTHPEFRDLHFKMTSGGLRPADIERAKKSQKNPATDNSYRRMKDGEGGF